MFITVSSNVLVVLLVILSAIKLLKSGLHYQELKEKYGDMGNYYIPSVDQARRIASIKKASYTCHVWMTILVITVALMILSFY